MTLSSIFIGFVLAASCSADLHNHLRYFETLDSVDLNVATRTKRSADGTDVHTKHINFRTLGRKFNLVLYPGSSVLSPKFKAKTVDGDGNIESFYVNPNSFFTGHLADDSSATVDAHFEDGVLSSSIRFPHDTYVVEPAWRHRKPSENYTMISYKGSDVNWEEIFPIDPETGKRTKMKDGIRLDKEADFPRVFQNNTTYAKDSSRHKRAAVHLNTCPLLVVADYHFFRDMGNKKRETTASFLISSIQNVNNHYKRTVFDAGNGYVNMGFQIDEMMIHTSFSKDADHYNYNRHWGYNEKLYAFSRSRQLNRFCLAHLFTSYPFADNVLGLAFIASESLSSPGGMCSIATRRDGKPLYPRTGWSSAKNARGGSVLSLQYELITTHGHNWGAEHDPEEMDDCAPSSDGKYVMWPFAVPGYDDNNKVFSPCSKRYIAPVLRAKSPGCFRAFVQKVDPSKEESEVMAMCGNGIVEDDEDCDVGFIEEDESDPCCDKECRFKNYAVCSDFNDACCKNCQMAESDVLCETENTLTCKGKSFCNGSSLECPFPPKLPDDTACLDGGKCLKGECLNFCALLGAQDGKELKPCLCTQNSTAMCSRCCAEVDPVTKIRDECLPTAELLQDGRTCQMGYCEKGECIKVEQKLAFRIFKFIKDLTVDSLVEMMKDNIVGTILVLSLLIWIPASWVVSCVDKRKIVENERDMLRWNSREVQSFGFQHSIMGGSREHLKEFRIKNSRFRQVPGSSQPPPSQPYHPPQPSNGVEDPPPVRLAPPRVPVRAPPPRAPVWAPPRLAPLASDEGDISDTQV